MISPSDRKIQIAVAILVVGTTVWALPLWLGVLWGARPAASPTPTPAKVVTSGNASVTGTPEPTVSGGTAPTPSASSAPSSSSWTTATYVRNYSGNVATQPKMVAIRTGSHSADSYDRIAFDFDQDSPPGYTIHYTDKVVRDASGQTVVLPGGAYLQIVFSPSAAHDDFGNSTLINSPTNPVSTQYDELWSYVMNGDFEGQVSMALGLASKSGYRVGEIRRDKGWTVYVDVLIQ